MESAGDGLQSPVNDNLGRLSSIRGGLVSAIKAPELMNSPFMDDGLFEFKKGSIVDDF